MYHNIKSYTEKQDGFTFELRPDYISAPEFKTVYGWIRAAQSLISM